MKEERKIVPPQRTRISVRKDGRVIFTDLWKNFQKDIELPNESEKIDSIGINDFGVLRGEEPLIDDGRGSAALYIHGCPLKCAHCYQPEFFSKTPNFMVSPDDFSQLLLAMNDQDAATVSIVMATYQQKVFRALKNAKRNGLHKALVWNFAGLASDWQISDAAQIFDIFLPDLKGVLEDNLKAQKLSPSLGLKSVATIQKLVATKKPVVVRYLLRPDFHNQERELRKFLLSMGDARKGLSLSLLTDFYDAEDDKIYEASRSKVEAIEALAKDYGVKVIHRGQDTYDS